MLELNWSLHGAFRRPWIWVALVLLVAGGVWVSRTGLGGGDDQIARMAQSKDVEGLAQVAASGSELDSCRAVKALANVRTPLALQVLRQRAQDDRAPVRGSSMIALARAGGRKEMTPAAAMLSQDKSAEARADAAKALGEAWDCDHVPDLIAALEDPEPVVTRQVQKSLARICGIEPGQTSSDPAVQRERLIKYYKAFWKLSGPVITRYHYEHRGK